MTKGPTPAMRQFYEMKERYPDCIVFFQMGDFFETFGEDARVVSEELDITLTSRGRTKDGERMPLAGVPVHAGESYVARLIQKGYRVALCEQVEDPKKAKGVVRRDVTRVITPGTVMDPALLSSSGPRYLMAIAYSADTEELGLAYLDISTGEFFISSCPADAKGGGLRSELARHRPAECIIPSDIPDAALSLLTEAGVVVTPFRNEAFSHADALSLLSDHFGPESESVSGCKGQEAKTAAAGACLGYAKETQHSSLTHIRHLKDAPTGGVMGLDAVTLRNLELVRNIRDGGSEMTLLSVLDHTNTAMGARILRSWIVAPLLDVQRIEERLDAVGFFVDDPVLRGQIRSTMHRFSDIERIGSRISYGNASPRDLQNLVASLEKIPGIISLLTATESVSLPSLLLSVIRGIADLRKEADEIRRAIAEEPPAQLRKGGFIRDGYSPQLDEIRSLAHEGKGWIAQFQEEERRRTGIKTLKVGYNKVFGYFIEVTKSHLASVPPDYIRKQTTANGERYTLPELKEKEALIVNAEERVSALECEIYEDLLQRLSASVPAMQETAGALGRLDVCIALAEAAVKGRYVRPVIEESQRLLISNGRHPVVEGQIPEGFVPNDASLDSGKDQILIITGANMAGKSTYMRQIGLISIMAQTGSFVPADQAVIGIADRVFTRVGAFDDLASGQSTFMVEMLELANILNNVTERSLVILDEIGRGTSTLDGYSIAKAVLEYLHGKGKMGPRTLFATHFHEIVEVEGDLKRVRNYHFAVRETGKEVIFLRKIIPGATDRSYGIHVARLAAIPAKVTGRAEEILAREQTRPRSVPGKREPRYTQLLLMDASDGGRQLAENTALVRLRRLDPDSMTPREALATLYELKKEAGSENDQ